MKRRACANSCHRDLRLLGSVRTGAHHDSAPRQLFAAALCACVHFAFEETGPKAERSFVHNSDPLGRAFFTLYRKGS